MGTLPANRLIGHFEAKLLKSSRRSYWSVLAQVAEKLTGSIGMDSHTTDRHYQYISLFLVRSSGYH